MIREVKGLADRITEDTLIQLEEDNALTRGLGNIKNSVMSLFSATANGKAKDTKAAKFLMYNWQQYARNKDWTLQNIHLFLNKQFGQQIGDQLASHLFYKNPKEAAKLGVPSTATALNVNAKPTPAPSNVASSNDNSAAQAPAKTKNGKARVLRVQKRLDYIDKHSKDSPMLANTQEIMDRIFKQLQATTGKEGGATPQQIAQAQKSLNSIKTAANPTKTIEQDLEKSLAEPQPSASEVMSSIQTLLASVLKKGKDSPEWKKAIAGIKNIQDKYGDKIPQLKEIDLTAFSESQITTSSKKFMTEAPNDPQSEDPVILGKEDVYNLFYSIAGWMVDSGVISVEDSRWTKVVKSLFGQNDTDTDDNHNHNHRYGNSNNRNTYRNDTTNDQRIDPKNASIDQYELKN